MDSATAAAATAAAEATTSCSLMLAVEEDSVEGDACADDGGDSKLLENEILEEEDELYGDEDETIDELLELATFEVCGLEDAGGDGCELLMICDFVFSIGTVVELDCEITG